MSRRTWIFFDADNTLWHVERLYDEARERFCSSLSRYGVQTSEAIEYQQERDHVLHTTYGYSAARFPQSFVDTLIHFHPHATSVELAAAREQANSVFERSAIPDECLPEAMRILKPHFHLAILTAGEQWVQERRLNAFKYRSLFDAIHIVPQKTTNEFRRLVQEHHTDAATSWAVGDSVRSDIIPARRAGLNAVLLLRDNWDRVERKGLSIPEGTFVANSLIESASIIARSLTSAA